MFYLREHRQRAEFWEGVRDQGTVAMGIGAWGLMTGVAMVKSGLSVLEALLMTLIVYAGSAQLAATPMIVAGAPLWKPWNWFGAIRYSRGQITVLDRPRIEELCCECYSVVKRETDRLMPPPPQWRAHH